MARGSFDLPFRDDSAKSRPGPESGETESRTPRAVVLKVVLPDDPSEHWSSIGPTDEIESLADTAGVEVVGRVLQRRQNPHPATYCGRGKLEETADLAKDLDASIVLVDDPIGPSQGKNIEDATERRVVDRAELIMDIFATRARSHQAKLQVELAQLRYSASRLTRMWTHLSRIEGGIGMRGPGETQLETDRRIIRRKIAVLNERLDDIEKQHTTRRKQRGNAFKIALVGYTNAGKSTLMRRLTGADILVEDRLFATLDTTTRKWELDEFGRDVLLSDTVGFIRKLPHSLVASFQATLSEAREADLLLHVVDASSPQLESDLEVVEETLERIDCDEVPTILVLNKVDKLTEDRRIDVQHMIASRDAVLIGAADGLGIEDLVDRVLTEVQRGETDLEYRLPHDRGDLASKLRQMGSLLEERFEEEGVVMRMRMGVGEKEQFERMLRAEGIDGA